MRLGVDHVDMYLIHEPDPETPLEETLDALDEVARAGKVRAIGASNVDVAWLEQARGRVQWVQNSYSLLNRESEDVLRLCAEEGLAFSPFSPLAGGWLAGKYRRDEPPPAGSRMTTRPGPYLHLDSEAVYRGLDDLAAAAAERGVDMPTLALAWLLADPHVTAIVVGPRRPEHLEPACAALDVELTACRTRRASVALSLMVEIDTAQGPARVHLHLAEEPAGALILGHGAGGGVEAPDLLAATQAALSVGISVALVEQPYRVAGRRSPPRAPQLDAAWLSVVAHLRATELADLQVVVGGRSMGARVACRTAEEPAPSRCCAWPSPSSRHAAAGKPPQSRLPELEAVTVPTLVVQGIRDPLACRRRTSTRGREGQGDHGLKTDTDAVAAAVQEWLPELVVEAAPPIRSK